MHAAPHSTDLTSPRPLWLMNVAPLKVLMGIGGLALLIVFGSIQYLLQQPYYDLQIHIFGSAITLDTGINTAPQNSTLHSIKGHQQNIIIDSTFFAPDPDHFTSFAQLDQFIIKQQQVYSLASSGEITLVFDDASEVTVKSKSPQLSSIPIEYWLLIFYGSIALFVGVGFWSYQRGHPITRLLALAGAGFAIMQYSMAIYAARELALPGNIFTYLIHINHFGGFLFIWSLTQFFWFYPKQQQGYATPIILTIITFSIWINEWYQWIEWPLSLFYFPSLFVVGIGFVIALKQWRNSKVEPQNRVLFFWIVTSITVCMGLVFIGYLVPLILFGLPWVSTWVANGLALCVFMGFILGANRNQLFGVENWWFKTWLCFSVFTFLIVTDIFIVYIFGFTLPAGFELALLAIWWLYFPIRSFIWNKTTGSNKLAVHHRQASHLPLFFQNESLSTTELWKGLLKNLYTPLDAHTSTSPCRQPLIISNGLKLVIPMTDSLGSVVLTGKNRGNKLFIDDDIRTVTTLLESIKQNERQRELQKKAIQEERDRIMRDLHDDVAANLLTLSHQTDSKRSQQLASDTLKNLREIIYCLDSHTSKPLIDLLFVWRDEIEERLMSADIDMTWHHDESLLDIKLSPRQWLNLGHSLRELISNAIKHAHPNKITFNWQHDNNQIVLCTTDVGQHNPVDQWKAGKGLCNIQQRAAELGGRVSWQIINKQESHDTTDCRATFTLPILPSK